MSVRTRFAPSPTGFLHVGGLRTALFSWLYARHHQGEFILRIEDTDQERSTKASVQAILDGLDWLGLNYDQGPFFQSQRYARYMESIEHLLEEGHAYRCYCSKERLEKLRETQAENKEKTRYDGHCRDLNLKDSQEPHVIRFKNPKMGQVSFKDEVYGAIHVENHELDDLIILRSDKHPTYNFAVVIDDWDMGITHVIRGDDHINNTPRQINIFNALKAPVPNFAHLPMILGDDGKRLSKRHGAVSVLEFRNQGVLPHALLNYLVRLGWSYGDKEIFSLEEMIECFNLNNVSRSAAAFNYDKLYWLNQHYLKSDPSREVAKALTQHFIQAGLNPENGPELSALVELQAERCKTLVELCQKSHYFYHDEISHDEEARKKHLRPVILAPFLAVYAGLKQLEEWSSDKIQGIINDVSAEFDINLGKIGQPLRVAVTGGSSSPSIDATLELIGKTRSLKRMEDAIAYIRERESKI